MAFHRTFPIGNLTLRTRHDFSHARLSILGVTFGVLFLILFSLKKKKWRLQKCFKNTKNESFLLVENVS